MGEGKAVVDELEGDLRKVMGALAREVRVGAGG